MKWGSVMNLFSSRIPRGVIYHSMLQSVNYFIFAMFTTLRSIKKIREFENLFAAYCNRKYCVAFPFARTAIYFILKRLDLPKGSVIILPPITIKGILDVVVELGLIPRYVDMDPNTMCFQISDLRDKTDSAVRAAIVTPLFGLVPNMEEISSILKNNNVYIIEDFSQCLNGQFNGKRIGTFGDIGVYSSSSIKTLDTLGGGLAVCDDPLLYQYLRDSQSGLTPPSRKFLIKKAWINLIRNFATRQPFFSFLTFPALQFMRGLNSEATLKQTGNRDKNRLKQLPKLWFCQYTSLQAQIGLKTLPSVRETDLLRIRNANQIKAKAGVEKFPSTTNLSSNVYWQLILIVANAKKAQSYFAGNGIDIATSSLELISELNGYPRDEGRGGNKPAEAVKIYHNGIFIPCYSNLRLGDIERTSKTVHNFFETTA